MSAQSPPRPGRNEPCHCGSGRKYKQCCLAQDEAAESAALAAATAAAASHAPDPAAATPQRPAKPRTEQPWKATTSRGFIPKARTPRKVGGS